MLMFTYTVVMLMVDHARRWALASLDTLTSAMPDEQCYRIKYTVYLGTGRYRYDYAGSGKRSGSVVSAAPAIVQGEDFYQLNYAKLKSKWGAGRGKQGGMDGDVAGGVGDGT